ncbi:MAG: acyl-CoA thioesterase [Pseudomonadota bacterium]
MDTDVLSMRVWPSDLDLFLELNNGRQLTLYDLGRFKLAARIGLTQALRRNRWGLAVAGSFIRYRRRLTAFQRFDLRTRAVGIDGRFILLEQAMWRGCTCHSHLLIRTAVTGQDGAIDPALVLEALGAPPDFLPEIPAWVETMMAAEGERPWPPSF